MTKFVDNYRLADACKWITVHPNGKDNDGTPVKLDAETGEVLGGMGGKFNGKHISAVPKKGAQEQHGAAMVIHRKHHEQSAPMPAYAKREPQQSQPSPVPAVAKPTIPTDKERYGEKLRNDVQLDWNFDKNDFMYRNLTDRQKSLQQKRADLVLRHIKNQIGIDLSNYFSGMHGNEIIRLNADIKKASIFHNLKYQLHGLGLNMDDEGGVGCIIYFKNGSITQFNKDHAQVKKSSATKHPNTPESKDPSASQAPDAQKPRERVHGGISYKPEGEMSRSELVQDGNLVYYNLNSKQIQYVYNTPNGRYSVSPKTPLGFRFVFSGNKFAGFVPNDMPNSAKLKYFTNHLSGQSSLVDSFAHLSHKHEKMPAVLAKVKPGQEMDHAAANTGRTNPNFSASRGYQVNCQTCVVAYEARRRGYNVEATRNSGNLEKCPNTALSWLTNLAWVDPNTGKPPEHIKLESLLVNKSFRSSTADDKYSALDGAVKPGERFTLEFFRASGGGGHIVSMFKDGNGRLVVYCPQSGQCYDSPSLIKGYLFNQTKKDFKFLRVDNCDFNLDVCNSILKKAR